MADEVGGRRYRRVYINLSTGQAGTSVSHGKRRENEAWRDRLGSVHV